ncbi:MAG: DUF4080 domain-containing protein [Clostridia bacterium]|nr:DUF4080 domain-containing protein [Clostridia bacterium]
MRVLLTTLNTKYVHTNIALRYLYETIKSDYDVIRKEFSINDQIEKIISDITDYTPDVIAFSVYIWNVEMTLKIAENIKQIFPNIKVILGGPEVSYSSEELIKKYDFIDYICVGEGEDFFQNLIKYIAECNLGNRKIAEEMLPNITYKNNNEIIVGEIGLVKDVTKIPRICEDIAKEYDGKIVYVETVRGCPYNCSYCLSSTIKGIRPFDMNRVKEELKILIDKKVTLIKFVDRTFNYDKKRAIEIWKYILDNNICSQFHFELSAHLIDEEMMDFLKTVPKDVFKFEIGVQSTNFETIKAINRTTDFKILSNIVKQLSEMKTISLHLDLIAGLPYEDINSFKNSFDDVYNLNPTELQLGFLKMLSGTKIKNEDKKFNYIYTTYPPYEVLQNDFISYDDLKRLKQIEAVLEFYYNSRRFEKSLEYIMNFYDSAFQFYDELAKYYKDSGSFDRKISTEEQYDIIAKFFNDKVLTKNGKYNCKQDNNFNIKYSEEDHLNEYEKFIQYLKFDFINHFNTKRAWMPSYDAKWIKEKIDNKVQEMLTTIKDENIYKKYKFEIFEIDIETGEKKQNLIVLRR